MSFPAGFLDELRARLRLSDVIGRSVRLQRHGREFLGLCPFHKEKTPSFTVNDQKGFYHCFGCGQHGSVFDFVMQTENLGFVEAVTALAAEAGLRLPDPSPEAQAIERRRHSLEEAVAAAATWYEQRLRLPEGQAALAYLCGRGLDDATMARFRLGFAPQGRGSLKTALTRAGFAEDLLVEAGLLIRPEGGQGSPYDRFRGRVMFPITERSGRTVGFGGRILGQGEPKYLNSPETALFHKGRLLYGYAQAREAARAAGTLIVVEGYMDVIGLAQAGYDHAVAPLGTALTQDQLELLWQVAPEPILWFDPDAAGTRAAVRAAEMALAMIRPGFGLKFAFSRLDTADDPADLARRYAGDFVHRTLADGLALSDLVYRLARQNSPLLTAEDRARLEERLDRHAARITDPTLRRHYHTLFRQRLREEAWQAGRRVRQRPQPAATAAPPQAVTTKAAFRPTVGTEGVSARVAAAERTLLAILLSHPALFADVEEDLGCTRFAVPQYDALRQALIAVLSQSGDTIDAGEARDRLAEQGFADAIGAILNDPAVRFAAIAQAGGGDGDSREQWQANMRILQGETLKAELATVETGESTAEAWTRRQRLIEARLQSDDDD
ncbi:MAG: DNA primase [Defluviicoccus sp.]|nr:DNA primase [Defluviicoccus sp.]